MAAEYDSSTTTRERIGVPGRTGEARNRGSAHVYDRLYHGQLGSRDEQVDPRIARQVLRAVIDAFTLLEVEQLGPDH